MPRQRVYETWVNKRVKQSRSCTSHEKRLVHRSLAYGTATSKTHFPLSAPGRLDHHLGFYSILFSITASPIKSRGWGCFCQFHSKYHWHPFQHISIDETNRNYASAEHKDIDAQDWVFGFFFPACANTGRLVSRDEDRKSVV